MQGICADNQGPLLDLNETWNTNQPRLSPCFRATLLVWVPSFFVIFFSISELIWSLASKPRSIIWSKSGLASLGSILFACISALGLLALTLTEYFQKDHDIYWNLIFSQALLFTLTLGLFGLNLLRHKIGFISSGFEFFSLLFLLTSGSLEMASLIMDVIDSGVRVGELRFILNAIYSFFIFLSFTLSFFALSLPEPDPESPVCPEQRSSFPNRLLFWWYSPLVRKGWRQTLLHEELWPVNPDETSEVTHLEFKKHLDRTFAPVLRSKKFHIDSEGVVVKAGLKEPSFVMVLLRTYGAYFLGSGLLKFMNDMLIFAEPIILKKMIEYASDDTEPFWHGILYVILLFISLLTKNLTLQQYYYLMPRCGLQVRSALISAVYRKAMKMAPSARKDFTVGEIVNLMSVDAGRMQDVAPVIHMIWSAPLQMGICMYLLYNEMGYAMFAGLGVFLLLAPVNGIASMLYDRYQEKQMERKDERVKFLTEILNGIKLLKFYAWEPAFQDKIQGIRGEEVGYLKKISFVNGFLEFAWNCSLLMVSIAVFTTYVLTAPTHSLLPAKAFVTVFLLNRLQFPISVLPMAITYTAMLGVSIRRLRKYLCAQEISNENVSKGFRVTDFPLELDGASFCWDATETSIASPVLQDISIKAARGSLTAVVGKVGSGKSSLLSALCGELNKINGNVYLNGSVAYAAQQAWIQNMTLRDNILFGKSLNESKYSGAVEACALKSDLELFPSGDQTEIGERGINLSGGQKQRVSLARSVYQDADIYLLDDPLSAVDVHVGKHIFNHVIGPQGVLKDKVRLLVSHNLTFLSQCDWVVLMNEGKVIEQGTYQDLLARKDDFAALIADFLNEAKDTEIEDLDEETLRQLSSSPTTKAALERRISRQKTKDGEPGGSSVTDGVLERIASVESDSAPLPMSPSSSSPRKMLGIERLVSEERPIPTIPEIPGLGEETKQKEGKAEGRLMDEEEMHVGKVNSILTVSWSVYWLYVRAAGRWLILYFLMALFVETAYGGAAVWLQIWSDNMASASLNKTTAFSTAFGLGVYGGFGSAQALVTIIMSIAFALGTVRASQTLHDSLLARILRAPMTFFDTTPTGRIVNRCGKDLDVVDNQLPSVMDQVLHFGLYLVSSVVLVLYSLPWFAIISLPVGLLFYFIQRFYVSTARQLRRLESVSRSPVYSFFQESLQGTDTIRAFGEEERFVLDSERRVDHNIRASYCLIRCNRWLGARLGLVANFLGCFAAVLVVVGRSSGISAGLVGLALSNALEFMDLLSWGVRQLSALETEIVAVERIKEYSETPSEASWTDGAFKLPQGWPPRGNITFTNYSTRYRPGLDLVLKRLTCNIKPAEKVGIVGRTGAGKSSLTLGIFRIIEAAGGRIEVDGVDVAKLGLHDLRKKIAIIPQDPLLFSGTMRLNLDPFDEHSDDALWSVLEISHLKEYVGKLEGGLSHSVSEGGSNLSVGQRQLLCLARALLRKARILIMDEATAAVDVQTDAIVQETIRREFDHCTVLTIAHRINTIMDSDKILVLENGKAVEFDSPQQLLRNEKSHFSKMVSEAGLSASPSAAS